VPSIACVSIVQTAAEKLVALTRRTAAEIADAGGPRDEALVRHLYDLHVIRTRYDPAEVAALAREIMPHDAEVFGNQFPAYRANPLVETLRAMQALAADPGYGSRYAAFCRNMVYGDTVEYAACMGTLSELARLLQQA